MRWSAYAMKLVSGCDGGGHRRQSRGAEVHTRKQMRDERHAELRAASLHGRSTNPFFFEMPGEIGAERVALCTHHHGVRPGARYTGGPLGPPLDGAGWWAVEGPETAAIGRSWYGYGGCRSISKSRFRRVSFEHEDGRESSVDEEAGARRLGVGGQGAVRKVSRDDELLIHSPGGRCVLVPLHPYVLSAPDSGTRWSQCC